MLDRLALLARVLILTGSGLHVLVAIGRWIDFVRFVSRPDDL